MLVGFFNVLKRIGLWFLKPIRTNGIFFVMMFLLGVVCTFTTLRENGKPYEHWASELFADVLLLTVLLSILPKKIGKWTRRLFYVVAYLVALADIYCFVKFDSTLTPTMILLVGETNSQEAGEFLESFLNIDLLYGKVGFVFLLMLFHLVVNLFVHYRKVTIGKLEGVFEKLQTYLLAPLGYALVVVFMLCLTNCWDNKKAFNRLMNYQRIGDVEHELTTKHRAQLYLPLYRLAFSIRANQLTAQQLNRLTDNIDHVQVDSCSYTSPHIVLIIGESFNKHHAQLYGYNLQNTPRQVERARKGELVPYSDVVAPWNLTSFVFKHLFSLYCVGDKGEWCDYPLFPEIFRKAGYHVTFLTNQFLPQAREAVYDFSGGFFLNNERLSAAMFDTRNTELTYFDDGMLTAYDHLKSENTEHNLTIFHLKGLHVDYRTRCPKSMQKLKGEDYDRPKLSRKERQILAYYDNAVAYNDSIVDQIIKRVEDEDAIVIYVPDHGEEVFDDDVHFHCRLHSAKIDFRLAHLEFEIPFWIYCSHEYMVKHPDIFAQVVSSKNRRYMTDALPHLLLYLAGIHTKDYRGTLNLLSPDYSEMRPRILKNTIDYDQLRPKEEME